MNLNVFTLTFDQFNAFLLNKRINFFNWPQLLYIRVATMPVDISNIVKGYLFIIILGITRQRDSTVFVYVMLRKYTVVFE